MGEYLKMSEALLELLGSLADNSSSDEERVSEGVNATRLMRGRINKNPPRPPSEYLCPYKGVVMEDPVLTNTGVTYDRKSLEEILKRKDGKCVGTGPPSDQHKKNSLSRTNSNPFVETYLRVLPNVPIKDSFWEKLIGSTPENNGDWLENDHINAWAGFLREARASTEKWSIVPAEFLSFLSFGHDVSSFLNGSNNDYPAWWTLETVYIPINIRSKHWLLGRLSLQTWTLVTYDSFESFTTEKDYDLLDNFLTRLPGLLQHISYSEQSGRLVPHKVTRLGAWNVPQQEGGHGDCGVFVCYNMSKLIHGESLKLETTAKDAAKKFREEMMNELFMTTIQ
ncbi:uncharacterized protein Tco_0715563 [Tanacetum coccineum]